MAVSDSPSPITLSTELKQLSAVISLISFMLQVPLISFLSSSKNDVAVKIIIKLMINHY